jgi:predicted nucleotidyltransferase
MQYTLRKIPREVDKALRQKARKERRSLNDVAIEALSRGAGVDGPVEVNHDLDFAIASWVEDPECEKTLEDQRKIDADLWK